MLKDAGSSMAGATVSMAHQAQAAAAKARAVQVSRPHMRLTCLSSSTRPSIPATRLAGGASSCTASPGQGLPGRLTAAASIQRPAMHAAPGVHVDD